MYQAHPIDQKNVLNYCTWCFTTFKCLGH